MSSTFDFIGDNIYADNIEYEAIPSFNTNDRLKFSLDVALNSVREKVKPQCKVTYKLLKDGYGYDPLLEIYTYPISTQMKYFLVMIHYCVTVVGRWVSFLPALIKRAKYRFNKNNFPHETTQGTLEITINNGWNTQIFHILHKIYDINFL